MRSRPSNSPPSDQVREERGSGKNDERRCEQAAVHLGQDRQAIREHERTDDREHHGRAEQAEVEPQPIRRVPH